TFLGTDQFVYQVCDNGTPQACDYATVYLVVQPAPSMELLKSGSYVDTNVDGQVTVEDHINYTFTIENTGNIAVANVTLTDPLFAASDPAVVPVLQSGDTNDNEILDVAETWTYTAE